MLSKMPSLKLKSTSKSGLLVVGSISHIFLNHTIQYNECSVEWARKLLKTYQSVIKKTHAEISRRRQRVKSGCTQATSTQNPHRAFVMYMYIKYLTSVKKVFDPKQKCECAETKGFVSSIFQTEVVNIIV